MEHGLDIRYEGISEEEFFQRNAARVSVLSGTNNCGKTLILKLLFERFGEASYLCGTNRYAAVGNFPVYNVDPKFYKNTWVGVRRQIEDETYNHDPVVMTFQDIFIRLQNDEREGVYRICSEFLGEKVELDFIEPGNSFSDSFLVVGGTPIAKCSSGSRLLVHLVSVLLSKKFKVVLIDEPELGLTPRIQHALQHFIRDGTDPSLSHLEHIYIATHSHIFLDRRRLADNFLVERNGKTVTVKQLSTYREFRDLQFAQLGNSFEHLQMPSGFLIVEGSTDHRFVNRLIQTRFPTNRINIIQANGDGQVKQKLHALIDIIGPLDTSPYSDRVLVLLDETHSPTIESELKKMGLDAQSVVEWGNNGIEYYYPVSILQTIFNDESLVAGDLKVSGEQVSHNGIEKRKSELCDAVVDRMTGSEQMDSEVEQLLEQIEMLC